MVAGSVLSAMAKHPVTSADVGYRGTQLKMTLVLDGQQQVIFKPRWYHKLCFNINFIFFYAKCQIKADNCFCLSGIILLIELGTFYLQCNK